MSDSRREIEFVVDFLRRNRADVCSPFIVTKRPTSSPYENLTVYRLIFCLECLKILLPFQEKSQRQDKDGVDI